MHDKILYPGQQLFISVAAVGQLQGTTPGTVYAEIRKFYDYENQNSEFTKIPTFQKANLINGSCTELSYTPLSEKGTATVVLVLSIKPNLPAFSEQEINNTIEDAKGVSEVNQDWKIPIFSANSGSIMAKFLVLPVYIAIIFKPCPLGFLLSEGSCNCTEVLQKHNLSCDITTQTVHKDPNMWIGTVQVSNATEVIRSCPQLLPL